MDDNKIEVTRSEEAVQNAENITADIKDTVNKSTEKNNSEVVTVNIEKNNVKENTSGNTETNVKAEGKGTIVPQSKWDSFVTKKLLAISIAVAILLSTILSVGITKCLSKPPKPDMHQRRPHMGLEVRNEYDRDSNKVSIMDVPGDNAKDAGFMPGDEIKRFDGEEIKNSKDLTKNLEKHKSGDSVKTEINRNGEEIEINSILD